MGHLKKIIEFLSFPELFVSAGGLFFVKCIVGTLCMAFLLNFYVPKYEFPDTNYRCNKVTGHTEVYQPGLCGNNGRWVDKN